MFSVRQKTMTGAITRNKPSSRIPESRRWAALPYLIAGGAALVAIACALFLYPEVAGPLHNKVTTDRYDDLALGLVRNGTLSFYPDTHPTVLRAPLYPFFLAALFALGEKMIPYTVQVAQALLHGLTCLMTFSIARSLAGRRGALIAAIACALHPYLLWYAGRMVIETASICLFTFIVFSTLRLIGNPRALNAAMTGLAIGAGVLCKSTYLPFVLLVPLLLLFSRPRRIRPFHALIVLMVSLAAIAPWINRNHQLTGEWGLVQALTGYNFFVGDAFVEQYPGSPLGYADIIARTDFARMDEGLPEEIRENSGARREALQDKWLLGRSLDRYANDPAFFVKKVAANAVMFWTLGSTPLVSIVTIALQLPLLFFFLRSAIGRIRHDGILSPWCIPIWLIATYFLIHLPVYALARFSAVFIPTMLAYLFRSTKPGAPASS
jgi:4-amino-4-deoxy-L-arabinose transferase-like glycosyltransferase